MSAALLQAPSSLQDAKDLLTDQGFATSTIWYHGTSSALLPSILKQGLKRSGDKAMNQMAKQTMATIGNTFTETVEPVFLTQSKEIAFYWAQQTVRNRSVRFEGDEQPIVLAVSLPDDEAAKVRPDVGAASLLMVKDGESYLAFIAGLYDQAGATVPEVNVMKADRMDYLNKLGMAYYDNDIPAQYLTAIS
ncbi:hypothetical protein [Parendozoicomonas haliclonae]|uniref:Uncharacterized protein n=1 Tax=Parendozoicomonas haliclonae TaxID=1960125 RepID=A0A1X7AN44_9GAMM|nr:hypothetical protein [Parendozoicomonas haliclonae]SMA47933.1 hypothetical protein EHSB41UT_02608 [Parendozoicomonas haliclonae]